MTCRKYLILGAILVSYLSILMAPGCMGGPIDKADGSFAGSMTVLGGAAVRERAAQTIQMPT